MKKPAHGRTLGDPGFPGISGLTWRNRHTAGLWAIRDSREFWYWVHRWKWIYRDRDRDRALKLEKTSLFGINIRDADFHNGVYNRESVTGRPSLGCPVFRRNFQVFDKFFTFMPATLALGHWINILSISAFGVCLSVCLSVCHTAWSDTPTDPKPVLTVGYCGGLYAFYAWWFHLPQSGPWGALAEGTSRPISHKYAKAWHWWIASRGRMRQHEAAALW